MKWPFKRRATDSERILAATIAKHDLKRVSPGIFTIDGVVWGIGDGCIVSQNQTRVDLSETAMLMLVAHLQTRPEVVRH